MEDINNFKILIKNENIFFVVDFRFWIKSTTAANYLSNQQQKKRLLSNSSSVILKSFG